MTYTQIAIAAAAAGVAFWPQISWAIKSAVKLAPAASSPKAVTYQRAMLALAEVRSRLQQTGGVPDDAGKAIEVITHALVEGSSE